MNKQLQNDASSLLKEFERTWVRIPLPDLIPGETRVGTPLCRMFVGKDFAKSLHILFSGPDDLSEYWPELGRGIGAYYSGPMMGFELVNYAEQYSRPIGGCNDPEFYPRMCGRIALRVFEPGISEQLMRRKYITPTQVKCWIKYLDFCERRGEEAIEFRDWNYASWRIGANAFASWLE